MKLDILQVPDCPNVAVLEQRIRQAIAGEPVDPEITHHVIENPGGAAIAGMTGSPTLLVNGHDPFATPGQAPSLSCRLYRSDTGRLDGAPSVAALRTALRLDPNSPPEADDDPTSACCTPATADGPVEQIQRRLRDADT